MDLIKRGSQTAKDGFKNEDDIVKKFNNWKKDKDAQAWLILMKYKLSEIEHVEAVKLSGFKTDVQVQVIIKLKKAIDVENLQVKLVSNPKGYNHIDKRWVLKPMNFCLNFFGNEEIEITDRENFKIGRITMQRKGGDGGRVTAKMLQFKINPAELFDIEYNTYYL